MFLCFTKAGKTVHAGRQDNLAAEVEPDSLMEKKKKIESKSSSIVHCANLLFSLLGDEFRKEMIQ